MTNLEKYKNEMINFNYDDQDICEDFIKKRILSSFGYTECKEVSCDKCHMLQFIWLQEEYEEPKEPEVDWSKVEVDTPIYVRDNRETPWMRRYFAKYENGKIFVWIDGKASWTSEEYSVPYVYGKLANMDE